MWEFLMRITVLAHFATWLACPLPTVQFTYLFPLPRGLKEPAKRFNWNGVSNGICSNSTWFIYQFDFDFVAFYRTRWFSPLYHSHIPFAFAFPVIAFNCTLLVCFESLRHRLSRTAFFIDSFVFSIFFASSVLFLACSCFFPHLIYLISLLSKRMVRISTNWPTFKHSLWWFYNLNEFNYIAFI